MRRLALTIVVLLLSVSSARAGPVWHFSGEAPGPPIKISFGGILPSAYVPTTAFVDFTLSAEGQTQTIYFDYFSLSSDPFTAQYTNTYLVDGSFTETATLKRTVTVDPITISTKHLGPFLLEGTSLYNFNIRGIYDNGMLDPFDQVRLIYGTSHAITGSVTVAGPTESLSQSFSFTTSPEVQNPFRGQVSILDLPDSVELSGFSPNVGLLDDSTRPFVTGTVDRVSFVAMCSGVAIYDESGTIHAESHTPEPTAPWLLLSGFIAAVVFVCLRSLAKSHTTPGKHTPPEAKQG